MREKQFFPPDPTIGQAGNGCAPEKVFPALEKPDISHIDQSVELAGVTLKNPDRKSVV